jgi:hypothetical protein
MPRDLRLCLHILVSSPYVHFWQYELFSVLSCVTSHSSPYVHLWQYKLLSVLSCVTSHNIQVSVAHIL